MLTLTITADNFADMRKQLDGMFVTHTQGTHTGGGYPFKSVGDDLPEDISLSDADLDSAKAIISDTLGTPGFGAIIPTLETPEIRMTESIATQSLDRIPQAPTPPVNAPVTGALVSVPVDLDDRGVPWNPLFHASTKTKTNDGSWKKKRGGDHEALSAYEASYTTVPVAATPGVMPQTETAPTPSTAGVMPQADTVPTPQQEPVPPSNPVASSMSAPDVMAVASTLIQSGKKAPSYLQELADHAGLGSIGEMFSNNDAIGPIEAKLRADGFLT